MTTHAFQRKNARLILLLDAFGVVILFLILFLSILAFSLKLSKDSGRDFTKIKLEAAPAVPHLY